MAEPEAAVAAAWAAEVAVCVTFGVVLGTGLAVEVAELLVAVAELEAGAAEEAVLVVAPDAPAWLPWRARPPGRPGTGGPGAWAGRYWRPTRRSRSGR